MRPAPFDYCRPTTVPKVVACLSRYGSSARLLAGGQSLLPLMNKRAERPDYLVDLNSCSGLAGVCVEAKEIVVGAMTRQADALLSDALAQHAPLMCVALGEVGHPETRTRGTLGGSIAFADPVAELPMVALALDAVFDLVAVDGERSVTADSFFLGPKRTSLRHDELLQQIRLPMPPAARGWGFAEMRLRRYEFPIVAVAVLASVDAGGRLTHVRMSYAGMGPRPLRAKATELALQGCITDRRSIADASANAITELDPSSDVHATAEYRRAIARTLTERALRNAVDRAVRT